MEGLVKTDFWAPPPSFWFSRAERGPNDSNKLLLVPEAHFDLFLRAIFQNYTNFFFFHFSPLRPKDLAAVIHFVLRVHCLSFLIL